LETLLDSSLATFVRYEKAPQSERDESVLHTIRGVRDYRENYPSTFSSTNADTNIQRILLLGK
ncbi:MAG TPA: hypothetical protein VKA67_06560, partial [Verrucomicrobiae bacterium]|nr:hypothetical protein [Verrucomicrobiae bacterium]